MEVGVQMVGSKEMDAVMKRLATLEPDEFFLDEFKPAADLMVTAIRNQTPVSPAGSKSLKYGSRTHAPGTLKQSIGRKIGKGQMYPTVFVGPNRRGGVDGWYNHIVIGGHEYGGTRVPPNPFVRRAFDAAGDMIQSRVTSRIKIKIQKLAGK